MVQYMVFRICAKVKNPKMQSKYTDSKFKQITLLFLPPTQKRQRKVNVGENNSMSGVSIQNICRDMLFILCLKFSCPYAIVE